MRLDLKDFLVKHVDVDKFYQDNLDDYTPGVNSKCPFHKDDTPSLSIRRDDGAFFCHGCGSKGTSLVGFYEALHKVSFQRAQEVIYSNYVKPIVPLKRLSKWSKSLLENEKVSSWIEKLRGVNRSTMKMLRLGWDGERIVIPIINEYGVCINVRKYHPHKIPKILSYHKGYGTPALYPLPQFHERDDECLLVEGEWDAILAWQLGYNVLTTTGGANCWKPNFTDLLKKKNVVVFYDQDEPGEKGTEVVVANLKAVAASIKILRPGGKQGQKDLSDFVVKGGWGKSDLDKVIAHAPELALPTSTKEKKLRDHTPIRVKLYDASKSDMFYRPIRTTAHVTGKRLTPFLAPKTMRISCRMDRGKICQSCHMLQKNGRTEIVFRPNDRRILSVVDTSDREVRQAARELGRIPNGCAIEVETLDTINMEEISVIPPIEDLGASYTARKGYYIGHGLASNRSYQFEGYTVPHPRDQSATHVFTRAETAQSHIETYELTPDVIKRLRTFNPGPGGYVQRIWEIEEKLSQHVTKILRRPDLHLAIDLVFHSPISFYFNGERLKKGWLEIAVIGDTRCGKGFVATELVKFYGLGEIATAENCSFAGLIGGLMKMGNSFSISWGVIPRNTDRLVIIDETSGLSTTDIAKMTRVRSEGIAEIFKIQAEATQARTRLIWLSNPRTGHPINTYSYGVECVSELFGKAEDVSKLDLALIVQGGDVSPEVINAIRSTPTTYAGLERDDFRDLVMWVWSRRTSEVFFSDKATAYILKAAMVLGKKYHPSIPLVQVEDIRVKLARLSAAVAGRVFSADATGKNLLVNRECATFAVSFLQKIYDNIPTNYKSYSESQYAATSLGDPETVIQILKNAPLYRNLVTGLLDAKVITISDVSDFTGTDKWTAKELVGRLVRLRCLQKEYTYYIKRPPFITLLRSIL